MKNKIRLFYYISKRLFKKKSYLVILLMVPALVLAMRFIATQESGVLRVALCYEDKSEKETAEIAATLLEMDSLLLFEEAESLNAAKESLAAGNVDAVWLFRENLAESLRTFATEGSGFRWEPPVLMLAREDNVALQLARERLHSIMAPYMFYYMYEDTIFELTQSKGLVPEDDMEEIYRDSGVVDCLVQFAYVDGTVEENANYLLTPLRGMLAILITVSGFAATLFFLQDEGNGVLDRISYKNRQKVLYLYQFAVMLYVCAAVLAALFFLGNATTLSHELVILCLFAVMNMCFCTLWKQLLEYPHRLAIGMLVCIVLMIVLCPIFLTVKRFHMWQCLLPPYFYLNSVHNPSVVPYMVIYCICGLLLNYFLKIVKEKVEFRGKIR